MLGITGVEAVLLGVEPLLGFEVSLEEPAPLTALSRFMLAVSMDCERGPVSTLSAGCEVGLSPQCCAKRERLSSIGVKMLCAFLADAGNGLGCGIGGLLK